MSQKLFRIAGRVIDRKTKQAIPGLRVEAIDKDLVVTAPFGSAVTDAQGAFLIEIDKKQIKELFAGRSIVLFFRVFRDGILIASTEDSALWDRENPDKEVTIKVKLESAEPPKPRTEPPPRTSGTPAPNDEIPFLVQGQVQRSTGGAFTGGTVRLFASGAGQEMMLGEAQPGTDGRFEITYNSGRLTPGVNFFLVVQVIDNEGKLLTSSPRFIASGEETVNLTVPVEPLRFTIGGKVTKNDLPVAGRSVQLFGTFTNDASRQRMIKEAPTDAEGRYFIEYDPAEFKVNAEGTTRLFVRVTDGNLTKESPLFLASPEENADIDLTGESTGEPPEPPTPPVPEPPIPEPLPPDEVLHQIVGILINSANNKALASYTVIGLDLDAEAEPRDMNYDTTDARGIFTLFYATPRGASPGGTALTSRNIRLTILDTAGAQVHQTNARFQEGIIQEIRFPLAEAAPLTLVDLSRRLNFTIPNDLLSALNNSRIQTLADIRKNGGIANIPGLQRFVNHPIAQLLQSHADLGRISNNIQFNASLINSGFRSVLDVVSNTRAEFVNLTHTNLNDFGAAQTQVVARAQERFLSSVATGIRTDLSNGFDSDGLDIDDSLFPIKCGCEDCQAAVSPLAYLADLLQYCLAHLKTNGPMSLSFLESRFFQSFSSLPASCESVDTQVSQVRICVEVLNKYLGPKVPAANLRNAEIDFLVAAYDTMLSRLGTSFEELRLARTASNTQRLALADRLGIDVGRLNDLTFDLSPASSISGPMAEIFGLVGLTRSLPSASTPVALQTWRLDRLRATWISGDHPDNEAGQDRLPIIDPDLIGPGEIKRTTPDNAYRLWQGRREEVDRHRRDIKATREGISDNAAAFNRIVNDTLGVPVTRLEQLAEDRRQGKRIEQDLAQLQLANDAFLFLLQVHNLISNREALLATEWEAVYSILAQVKKRQSYAAWRDEERAAQITLSPDYFQPLAVDVTVFPPPPPVPLPEWLATTQARRAWEDTLQARTGQRDTVIAGVQEAIGATEEATLPGLRDALIMISGVEGASLEAKAKRLTELLLIDAAQSGHMKTTRISQAIETLQVLLFSVRDGLLAESHSDLDLDADDFDEEWEWLGSYATWRAAMFVFLYPENVLIPSLKRWQTPGFRSLVSNLRANTRLTPKQASQLAKAYSDYFKDVCTLKLDASCHALTHVNEVRRDNQSCTNDRRLFYVFARGQSNAVYWSSVDTSDNSAHAQTYWDAVPGLLNVVDVIGASVYEEAPDQRFIFLFAITREEDKKKLVFSKYDLIRQVWTVEPEPLELPPNEKNQEATDFTAVVKQHNRIANPPHLAICLPNGALYVRKMNRPANGWADGDWQLLVGRRIYNAFVRVEAMVEIDDVNNTEEYYLMVRDKTGKVQYRLIEPLDRRANVFDDGRWRVLSAGALKGAFAWPDSSDVFVYLDAGTFTHYFVIKRGSVFTDGVSFSTATDPVGELEQWFNAVVGVSLSQYVIKDNSPFSRFTLLDFLKLGLKPKEIKIHILSFTVEISKGLWKEDSRYIEQLNIYLDDLTSAFTDTEEGKEWKSADAMIRKLNGGAFNIIPPGSSIPTGSIPMTLRTVIEFALKGLRIGFLKRASVAAIGSRAMTGLDRIVPNGGFLKSDTNLWAYSLSGGQVGIYRTSFIRNIDALREGARIRLAPHVTGPFEIAERLSENALQERRSILESIFDEHLGGPASNLDYIEEAYYFAPVQIAIQLQSRGHYTAALDLLRTVYDYTQPIEGRKIYPWLGLEEFLDTAFTRDERNWLLDPLNPHSIATTRRNNYTRYTILALIKCFLDFADAEFTRDTIESVARARELYLSALQLLDTPELKQNLGRCADIIGSLDIEIAEPQYLPVWNRIRNDLSNITNPTLLTTTANRVRTVMGSNAPLAQRLDNARDIVSAATVAPAPPTLGTVVTTTPATLAQVNFRLLAQPDIFSATDRVGNRAASDFSDSVGLVTGQETAALPGLSLPWLQKPKALPTSTQAGLGTPAVFAAAPNTGGPIVTTGSIIRFNFNPAAPSYTDLRSQFTTDAPFLTFQDTINPSGTFVPAPSFHFCIPPNPILLALRSLAELNLYKMRNGRNIAGIEREIDPYAAPTDTFSGLPSIGAGGQLVLPGTNTLRPTAYRYATLIERAKQLVNLAQQIEASMLSAIEKRDAEFYNLLKARQDTRLARAGVRLQDLRVRDAENQVKLTELQQERAQIQFDHYTELIKEDTSILEELSLASMLIAAGFQIASAAASFTKVSTSGPDISGGLSSLAAAANTTASFLSTLASYERRAQEWQFQKTLAQQDIKIGAQQIRIANDRVRITAQERVFAQTQFDNAEAIADFLANKFTNAELYDWMSGVLEGVYSYFLQQATSTAQIAAAQLAFERQEAPPPFIQDDYWEVPTDAAVAGGIGGSGPDRRGLTGSARLLQDIFQLDQHAFETNERKLQLTKSVSLAQLLPAEFQRFRETGVLRFHTAMEMFDRDYPGHYLRLIRRVRTSVIALIPPVAGIRATLSTVGPSRVVIGEPIFQKVEVNRNPETLALSSPRDATGLFELDQQPELLLPFEGTGVETGWEFRMPKASNLFDYNTIADVILTIEYTALNSFDYRQQVLQALSPTISADMPFSFRQQFADQWYDLHNPDQTATPMIVSFKTRREDFPPNLEGLRIEQVLLHFVRASGESFEVTVEHLRFVEQGSTLPVGGAAQSVDGIISTRRGNAPNWIPIIGGASSPRAPFGTWELRLRDDTRDRFKNEQIEEMLFVITYSGRMPAWPA